MQDDVATAKWEGTEAELLVLALLKPLAQGRLIHGLRWSAEKAWMAGTSPARTNGVDQIMWRASLMPLHRGGELRVAHRRVDEERDEDAARQIPVEPGFVADALEPQGHRLRGAAENRHGERVGDADPGRSNEGREQLGLHDGIDRGVAGD